MSWRKIREIWWRPVEDAVAVPRAMVSGSGLILADDGLWAVGDDLHHLIRIPLGEEVAEGYRLFAGDLPDEFKARKKMKPDTEVLFEFSRTQSESAWIAMPSGSKPRRIKGALIRKGRSMKISEVDFSSLYEVLHSKVDDLNIEGAAILGEKLVLFQRGNGVGRGNALISMDRAEFARGLHEGWALEPADIEIEAANLGEWDGIPLTFTDGFAHKGRLFFSAAAEDTESTFEDGEVAGSVVGIWEDGQPRELARIEGHKVEGLALDKIEGGQVHLYAITDADESLHPSILFALSCNY